MFTLNEIKISFISNRNDIFYAINDLSNYLYNQKINNLDTLKSIADKYSKYATVLVASILNKTVGLSVFYDNDNETKTAFISMIVVAKDVQGKGVGGALIDRVFEQCTSNGMKQVRLKVANSNENAIRFYIKHGFKLEKKMKDESFYVCKI